jgi:hypothetical protein
MNPGCGNGVGGTGGGGGGTDLSVEVKREGGDGACPDGEPAALVVV